MSVQHRGPQFRARLNPLALAIHTTLVAALLAGSSGAASAQAVAASAEYDIAPGPLADALNRFAQQAGVAIVVDPRQVQGMRSPGLKGRLGVEAGFAALLGGSGYLAARTPEGYVLRKAPEPAKDSGPALPPVTVRSSALHEQAAGPVDGFVARRSATATKTDTAIIDTPQSIAVITRDRMDAQAVQTTEQALRYTAGVLTEVTGYDLRYQSLVVRGFDTANYRDGLRTFAAGSYADWVAEPQGLERVELLKGPASVLYGQAAPGGLVNQVSKRPRPDPVNEVSLTVGNHERRQAAFDLGGLARDDGSLLFRVNGLARDSRTQTDSSRDDRLFLAPSVTWRPSAATSLTVLADVTRDRVTPKSWWPDYALTESNPNGKPSRGRFIGEPGFDHYDRDMASLAYLLEHQVSDTWTLRQNVRYAQFKLDYQHAYGDVWQSDQRTLDRGTLVSRTKGRSVTADNQAQTQFRTGLLDHRVLLGLDFQHFSGREDLGFGSAPSLDAFAPVYGVPVEVPETSRSRSSLRQMGGYVQDQVRAGGWIANIGVRHDQATAHNWDDSFDLDQRDSKLTYNLGLMFQTSAGLAPYASYATSFNPTVDVGFGGRAFKPETGQQVELGVKYQPKGSSSMVTLAVFDLRKQNVTTDDPDHDGYSLQTGEVRSRGIELEGTAALSRQIDLVAGYTYLDARVTRSNDPGELDRQPRQTARNLLSMWLDYRFAGELLQGWSAGAGVRYVDKVAADAANTHFNPSYTLVDMALRYKAGPVTVALNAANLFDKTYVANRSQFYGQGRALQATLGYRW